MITVFSLAGCKAEAVEEVKEEEAGEAGTVTDIDGNVYHTVTIGTQVWMVENLKVTHYRNGDPIPNVTDDAQWESLTTGAYCNYDNDSNNADTYGCLYNWYAVNDSRNICPTDWHVPTNKEWVTLVMYLGGTDVAGGKMKETGITHWNINFGATNESGFSALPGGYRGYDGGFGDMRGNASFWSSTEYDNYRAWGRGLGYSGSKVARDFAAKGGGGSVRCVRD